MTAPSYGSGLTVPRRKVIIMLGSGSVVVCVLSILGRGSVLSTKQQQQNNIYMHLTGAVMGECVGPQHLTCEGDLGS